MDSSTTIFVSDDGMEKPLTPEGLIPETLQEKDADR